MTLCYDESKKLYLYEYTFGANEYCTISSDEIPMERSESHGDDKVPSDYYSSNDQEEGVDS